MTSKINYLKKRIIISISAIILLIITLIGITYAYFIAAVAGNTNEKSVGINAGMLRLTYGDGNGNITVNKIIPGKTIAKKTFTVKNTGTHPVENYDVYLENVLNELEYDEDLVYTLTCLSDDESICNGSEGVFPKTNYVIATNTINVGVTHYYEIVLTYKETNTDQSIDMNKTIDAKINIRDDINDIKTLKIYGNSIQNEMPTPTSPVKIKNLGEPTDNLVDIDNATFMYATVKKNNGIYTYTPTNFNDWCRVIFEDVVSLKAGETMIVSFKINRHGNVTEGLRYYNIDNGESIDYFSFRDDESTLTTRTYTYTATKNIRIGFMLYLHVADLSIEKKSYEVDFSEFYVSKTTEFTGYEPVGKYKIPIKDTNSNLLGKIILDEPLRKVGDCDNCADYIDIENGLVVRNVKELELKTFIYDPYYSLPSVGNYSLFYKNKLTDISNDYAMSDYFIYSTEFQNQSNHITIHKNSNRIYLGIDSTLVPAKDYNALNAWLNENNPKIYYVSSKPEKYSINLNAIRNLNELDKIVDVCTDDVCASKIEIEYDK